MSNFTPTVKFETEFEGDTVRMNLRRLKRGDMMKLSPYLTTETGGAIDGMQLMDISAGFIRDYVFDFCGLTDAEGSELPFTAITDEVYFLGLISEIITRLFEISNMGEGDEKNSGVQPSMSTVAQAISEASSSQG